MADDIRFAVKVFAALFAIMNPIANVPIFLPLTEGGSDAQRHRTAVVAIIAVGIGCVVSALAGGAVLSAFGLTVDDFRLAGGLMVLLIALSMLNGPPARSTSPRITRSTGPLLRSRSIRLRSRCWSDPAPSPR